MLLAVDAGNTNIVFALLDGREVKGRWRIATDPRRTADEYAVWLSQLLSLEGYDRSDVTGVVISTVVPRATHNLQVLAEKYFKTTASIAGQAPLEYGMAIDVAEPQSLGADRAVNAIAAHALHQGDLIVIDFGTATTVDWIDYRGAYKGGIIAPGINLSLDALVNAAAKLPRIAIEAPADPTVIGRDTVSQMQIGIYWGYIAMIEGLVARMKAEVARPVMVVATGGLAVLFEKHTAIFDHVESDLTIQGLAMMWERAGK
ncbi:MAG: type III pantothenate kinase [Sphingomonas sp.]|uniref:type III pantothenate kinase n=1 Tax=Sphingomonas sp. TaxID=28214 RepID=UPI001AD55603|nr:type III pantothenate kinase [Sphingomonas sp.]MBN8807208.1 type III pantothenate kinase [Sphingomonas sp.]